MSPAYRVRLGTVVVVLFSFLALLAVKPAHANPRYAAIVVDAESGDVLHAANADATRYPASLTKMMTLYLVFEALEDGGLALDQPLPVSSYAASKPASKLYLKAGSTIPVEKAIQALVIKSANDVAVVVAEALGGSEEHFATMMTRKAQELGMSRTTFRNPHGLPDARQVTTARDMAILSLRVMKDFPQHYHYFSRTRFHWNGKTITGHNRLLDNYPGADGLKTGFIRASGFNVATSAVRNGRRVLSVVMGGFTAASRDAHMADLLDRGYVRLALQQRGDWIAKADLSGERMALPEPLPATPPATQLTLAETIPSWSQSLATGRTEASALLAEPDTEMGSADDPIRELLARNDPASPGGAWAVQVGAFSDVDQARSLAARAADSLASQLNDVRVAIAEAQGAPRVFRARLVDLQESDARTACQSLRQQGMDCLVVAHN
ncbi:D-alanyl-D-alanine carboxypeptidase [Halomonas sp. NO4]|uniref:D-alanyl-D-alanine carboxypeptidase n=1 Tax=Halomonas sp. NO4 TaxID=2484813 RepID=UPI0013D05085|nr:D-alanyl-D-alanine carboxypeptidase [Halomonas sp. NO4]